MTITSSWRRSVQAGIGVAISAIFVAITLSRVNFELMADAWASVSIVLLAIAVSVAAAEVATRAVRWQILLRPLTNVGFGTTLGYLAIGHLANAVLPARLGDLGRALLAGSRLNVSRVSVLGTIAVERVSDATLIGIAAGIGILVGYRDLVPAVAVLGIGGLAAGVVLTIVAFALNRETVIATRLGAVLRRNVVRVAAGTAALRDHGAAIKIAVLTATSFVLAVLVFQTVASAVGVTLAPWQSAFAMAAVTLSTAVPAGPASIGTYEFVGVTVLTSMGVQPEQSLLCVALVHAAVTLTPSAMGAVAMWLLGIKLPARSEEVRCGPSTTERMA